jgi:hypothetical protein
VTATDAGDSQVATPENTMPSDRFMGIAGTAGVKATAGDLEGGKKNLIDPNEYLQNFLHHRFPGTMSATVRMALQIAS